jgi:thiamine biosynthesis protein ThiS
VAALVTTMQLEGKRYAIERNGEIVPKSAVDSTPVEDGDQYEVVIAVGGG